MATTVIPRPNMALNNPEVEEYMVRRLHGTIHPALDAGPESGVIYDGRKRRWIAGDKQDTEELDYGRIYKNCVAARDEFLETAKKHRNRLKIPEIELYLNETTHNWVEVESSMNQACAALEQAAQNDKNHPGFTGTLQRAFRSFCKRAGCGQTFVTLIPSELGFGSVICGGLKIIFSGMEQAATYRDEVYLALEELPSILHDHTNYNDIFEDDEELHVRTASLYTALFKLLRHFLMWFGKNPVVTAAKTLMNPTRHAELLKERLTEVKKMAKRFEKQVIKLAIIRQDESRQVQYSTAHLQTQTHQKVNMILERTEVLQKLDDWLQNHSAEMIALEFEYESDLLTKDCTALLRLSNDTGRASVDQDRVQAIQSNRRLREWLSQDKSLLLLLNGRADPKIHSETSLVSARIVEVLQQGQATKTTNSIRLVPLAFFCGQHRDSRVDPNGTPEELMMSLLLQLVASGVDIKPATLQRCFERTKPGLLKTICRSFERIVMELGETVMVYVIIDGLRVFQHRHERGLYEVVRRLVGISRKQPSATLKVLFSSPTRSHFVEELFKHDEILHISETVKSANPVGAGASSDLGEIGGLGSEDEDEESDYARKQNIR